MTRSSGEPPSFQGTPRSFHIEHILLCGCLFLYLALSLEIPGSCLGIRTWGASGHSGTCWHELQCLGKPVSDLTGAPWEMPPFRGHFWQQECGLGVRHVYCAEFSERDCQKEKLFSRKVMVLVEGRLEKQLEMPELWTSQSWLQREKIKNKNQSPTSRWQRTLRFKKVEPFLIPRLKVAGDNDIHSFLFLLFWSL